MDDKEIEKKALKNKYEGTYRGLGGMLDEYKTIIKNVLDGKGGNVPAGLGWYGDDGKPVEFKQVKEPKQKPKRKSTMELLEETDKLMFDLAEKHPDLFPNQQQTEEHVLKEFLKDLQEERKWREEEPKRIIDEYIDDKRWREKSLPAQMGPMLDRMRQQELDAMKKAGPGGVIFDGPVPMMLKPKKGTIPGV